MRWKWMTPAEKADAKRTKAVQWQRHFAYWPRWDWESRTGYWLEYVWSRWDGQSVWWTAWEHRGGRDAPETKLPPATTEPKPTPPEPADYY